MSKKSILIALALVFVIIAGCFALCFYLKNKTVEDLKVDNAPAISEEDRIRLEKQEARIKMLEILDKEKIETEVLTPEQKQITRQRLLNSLNEEKEEENTELTREEKQAARIEMLEKLNSEKIQD